MGHIDHIPLSQAQQDMIHGDRKVKVGKAFRNDKGHFWLQREHDVLHVGDRVINTLHKGCLNTTSLKEEINIKIFHKKLKETIYTLDIGEYWNLKELEKQYNENQRNS